MAVQLTLAEGRARQPLALEAGAVRKNPDRVSGDEFQLVVRAAPDGGTDVDYRDEELTAERGRQLVSGSCGHLGR